MIIAPQTPELGIRDIKRVEFGIKPNMRPEGAQAA
jgi:hypothetical protein